MRVTSNLMVNRFSRSLNTTAQNLSSTTAKVSSGRNFSRTSQDVSNAMKAYKIRRGLARNELYEQNVSEVAGALDQTETTMMGIKEVLINAQESLVQGATGSMADSDREAIADIFRSLQDQLLKLANTNFAGKFIFGGTNTTSAPFTVQTGTLYYNGQDVNSATINADEIYMDLGLGLAFDAMGQLKEDTAFSISTPGSAILGYGVDGSGSSNNIYNFFGEIVTALQNNDTTQVEQQIKKLSSFTENIMVSVASIGEKVKFVEFIGDRLSTDKLNLQTRQSEVEDVNHAKAIIDYSMAETTYTAALQMGAKIIQKSLLDFLQ